MSRVEVWQKIDRVSGIGLTLSIFGGGGFSTQIGSLDLGVSGSL